MTSEVNAILETVGTIILGKTQQLRLTVACILASGHLLIEDLPGVGKTTLAHAIARVLGLDFQRVQFTSDLLPADVLGASIFNRETGAFEFHPGPVFSQVVLADEVNRATPKAQSALLEAMEEQQVTVEGVTRRLPEPFFVIATQNPAHQIGTFSLPESQLDRFLMRLRMGYPDAAAERALLAGEARRTMIAALAPAIEPADLVALQRRVRQVHVSPALLDYLQAILGYTRRSPEFAVGLSPRAGLALLNASRAWAFMDGRSAVIPEDVQSVFPSVAGHRLIAASTQDASAGDDAAARVIASVAIP
ncbi:MAG: MoxR family ATPase [Betaproteobacteria bacterium]